MNPVTNSRETFKYVEFPKFQVMHGNNIPMQYKTYVPVWLHDDRIFGHSNFLQRHSGRRLRDQNCKYSAFFYFKSKK